MARRKTKKEEVEMLFEKMGIPVETLENMGEGKARKMTLLKAFEKLLDEAEDSRLQDSLFENTKELTDFIGEKLDITPMQAVLMSVILNGDRDEVVELGRISRVLGCRNIQLFNYLSELDGLVKKHLLTCRRRSEDHGYRVPLNVLNALKDNQKWEPEDLSNITFEQLIEVVENLYINRDNMENTIDELIEEVKDLFSKNLHLNLCKKVMSYPLDDNEKVLLVYFVYKFVCDDDEAITLSDFSDVFDSSWRLRRARNSFRLGRNPLLTKGFIEPNNDMGLFDGHSFCLTDKTKKDLLPEMDIESSKKSRPQRDVTLCEDIVEKKMFYNPTEKAQVKRLQSLLDEKQFADIVTRIKEKGMRTGFTCLFYGQPGTGKTETVLQLARITGRDIMQVDIPSIKSKWVGDSEKNIKAVFERYREAVSESEKAPILLFNEADAVLGVRTENAERAVDKMENAIQNIILQEMETLQGIMIATTNLTSSLDKAFERRFLYKIRFEKPALEAKRSIWRSMLPELDEQQAQELAESYEFSGGQIENIARKKAVDDILNGAEGVDMSTIRGYCDTELIDNKGSRYATVGFRI